MKRDVLGVFPWDHIRNEEIRARINFTDIYLLKNCQTQVAVKLKKKHFFFKVHITRMEPVEFNLVLGTRECFEIAFETIF